MEILLGLLEASVVGGIGIGAFYLISRIFDRRYQKRYKMIVWMFIAVRLLMPGHLGLWEQPVMVEIPVYSMPEHTASGLYSVGTLTEAEAVREGWQYLSTEKIIFAVWFTVFLLFMTYYAIMYIMGNRKLQRISCKCEEEQILLTVSKIAGELKCAAVPQVRMLEAYKGSPFTVGMFRNIIYLPKSTYGQNDLDYIVRHEMHHCKNKDVFVKAFMVVLNAVHWFNPLVWLMRYLVSQDMELICDEAVLRDATRIQRREYCELVMSYMEGGADDHPSFSIGYFNDTRFAKNRFKNIFAGNPKRRGGLMAAAFFVILIAVGGVIGFTQKDTAGKEKMTGEQVLSNQTLAKQEEIKKQELARQEEITKQELERQEEIKKQELAKQEEIKKQEEITKQELARQEEIEKQASEKQELMKQMAVLEDRMLSVQTQKAELQTKQSGEELTQEQLHMMQELDEQLDIQLLEITEELEIKKQILKR